MLFSRKKYKRTLATKGPQMSQTSFMVPKASKYSNNTKIEPRCDTSITMYLVGLLFYEDLNLHK